MQDKQEQPKAGESRRINTSTTQLSVMKKRVDTTVNLKMESDSKYILSYGGGVNSTALIIFVVKNKFPLDHVVFSDTGDEMPETYEYLGVMRKYLKRKKIPFEIVRVRNKESLSDRCLRRKVVPSQVWRWCTRDMKVAPIHAFYRTFKCHIYQYMGIDYDEFYRMKPAKPDYVSNLYPLVDHKIGREGCIQLIKKAHLPIPVKSGCFFCPYNNMDRWKELYEKHPDLFKYARKIEENGKHMPKQKLAPREYTLKKLEEELKQNKPLPMIHVESPCGSECMV